MKISRKLTSEEVFLSTDKGIIFDINSPFVGKITIDFEKKEGVSCLIAHVVVDGVEYK